MQNSNQYLEHSAHAHVLQHVIVELHSNMRLGQINSKLSFALLVGQNVSFHHRQRWQLTHIFAPSAARLFGSLRHCLSIISQPLIDVSLLQVFYCCSHGEVHQSTYQVRFSYGVPDDAPLLSLHQV